MKIIDPIIQSLIQLLDNAPTSFHLVEIISKKLKEKGFEQLHEQESWKLKPKHKYFIIRGGSTFCAFITPQSEPTSIRLLASHSDSPGLKLKPQPEIKKQNCLLLGTEIYGAPLLNSWLNRDLGIAGRVIFTDRKNQLQTELVRLDDNPLTIPQLAIHLDRDVNEKGLILNKQENLNALAALTESLPKNKSYLETMIREQFSFKELINFDLFLYPLEPARLLGFKKQFLASYRIDNLASVHASWEAFSQSLQPLKNEIKMIVSWDHEEIGSNSVKGASSPFLSQIFERILLALDLSREDYFKMIHQSLCVSIDMAHATHPNYSDKHDAQHSILLGGGVVLKSHAQQRYATDGLSSLTIQRLASKNKIPLQKFSNRNDIPCGTTVGPIHATVTGMPSVDIGCPQLSMHASRELMACQDHLSLCKLLKAFLD